MEPSQHLYLFTLEVAPLQVGETYNPLPSHLTLMSRFWSTVPPKALAAAVSPTFDQTAPIELIFGQTAELGPQHTPVHLVENTAALRSLHARLRDCLDTLGVRYTLPQYTGGGYKPHVSQRPNAPFAAGHRHVAPLAYLIAVEQRAGHDLRFIQAVFALSKPTMPRS